MKKYTQAIIKIIGINTFIAVKVQYAACTGTSPDKFYARLKLKKNQKTPAAETAYFFRNELLFHFKEFAQYQTK